VQRLEQVFTMMGLKPKGKSCEAMEGLIAEGKDILSANAEDSVKDAGLIAAANKVEHYEIAGYGTLVTWAQQLGRHDAANLLEETLHEEKSADQKLTHIAEGMVNLAAAHGA
jgi:ferritin-like metal-binding protein YciE